MPGREEGEGGRKKTGFSLSVYLQAENNRVPRVIHSVFVF